MAGFIECWRDHRNLNPSDTGHRNLPRHRDMLYLIRHILGMVLFENLINF